ncbi:MAG: DUF460 domain-containing protein [Desulfurococcaceae archaeon]
MQVFYPFSYVDDMGVVIKTIMGIDILPGYSPYSTKLPHYAVVVLRDGRIIGKYDDVPLNKVLRLVLEYHVDAIAVDNVYEIARDNKDLIKIMSLLPPNCKIIQVTGIGEEVKGVSEIARELDLQVSKPSPLYTAFINAYAVYNGYGQELRVFGDKTLLIITKGRTVSQGGMSSERFKRSIRASILHVTKKVKEILDENKIDYDMVLRKSEGGLERSMFIIYAPRERLYGLIKPIRHKNIKIIIRPVLAKNTYYRDISPRRPVIVGLDPGMNIGVAVIDIYGRPVFTASVKGPDRDEVLRQISHHGDVVILATDMSKPPDFVKKMAGLLNAVLYAPDSDISIDEKNRVMKDVVERYGVEIPDTHVRDALVAAVKAYHSIKNLVEEIMAKIEKIPGIDKEKIVAEVIRGKPLSEVLDEYFMKTLNIGSHGEVEQIKREKSEAAISGESINKLHERIRVLENTVKRLEEELREKELVISDLKTEIKLLRSRKPGIDEYERRIALLNMEIDHIKRKLEEKEKTINTLKERIHLLENMLISLGKGDLSLIPRYSSISCEDIYNLKSPAIYLDITDNDIGMFLGKEIIECMKNNRIALLVGGNVDVNRGLELGIPIVKTEVLLSLDDYVLVRKEVLIEVNAQWKEIERRRVEKMHENIIKMIEEYQRSRRKLV